MLMRSMTAASTAATDQETARSRMRSARTSLRSGSSCLLSFRPRIGRSGERMTAPAKTAPNSEPRPTSSTPAIAQKPRARSSRSRVPSQRSFGSAFAEDTWALPAMAEADLANRDGLAHPRVLTRDYRALEGLHALFVAFLDLDVYANGVARPEHWYFRAAVFLNEFAQQRVIHNPRSFNFFYRT